MCNRSTALAGSLVPHRATLRGSARRRLMSMSVQSVQSVAISAQYGAVVVAFGPDIADPRSSSRSVLESLYPDDDNTVLFGQHFAAWAPRCKLRCKDPGGRAGAWLGAWRLGGRREVPPRSREPVGRRGPRLWHAAATLPPCHSFIHSFSLPVVGAPRQRPAVPHSCSQGREARPRRPRRPRRWASRPQLTGTASRQQGSPL